MALAVAYGLLAALALAWAYPVSWGWRFPSWGLPGVAIVAALTLARVPVARNAFWRLFAFLGDASYSLYLFHTLSLALSYVVLGRWITPASAPWLLQRWIEPNRREPIPAVAPDIAAPVNSPAARG
jgi:peptidoglycan/LPS O-acetylase OafA/YrhL